MEIISTEEKIVVLIERLNWLKRAMRKADLVEMDSAWYAIKEAFQELKENAEFQIKEHPSNRR